MNAYKLYKPSKWERRIDSLIRALAPMRAEKRAIARERMNFFRYLAAQATSARENASPTTSGEWLRGSLEKQQVMWNAINCVDNSGLCSGIVLKFQTYVCGTLRWQARTGDKDINKQYEDYILEKTKGRNIDIVGRDSLRQMCMLDVKGMIVKGDIGTNIVRGDDDQLYLQGIEGDRIGNPYRYQTNDRYVRGLILDRVGRVEAVKVFHRNRMSGLYEYDATFPMVDEHGLPAFLFMVNPISYDDKRGVSVFKSAIDNATYIARMREYELQALLWAASQSGVYYTKTGLLPESLPFNKPSNLMDASGNVINTYQARPNTIIALGSDGEKVEMFQHDRPSPNVIGMYNNTVRDIAVGTGLSFAFAYDMSGLSGPGVRMASWQDTRAIAIWQEILREQKLDPVVMLLLGDAIAKGELPYHENWLQWQWFFPPKPTIDAGYDSQANIQEIEAGVQSASSVAMMRGEDIDDIQAQRAQEIEDAVILAQEIGQRVKAPWQQIFALMRPSPRGSLGPAGQSIGPGLQEEAPGATSGGVTLEGEPAKHEQRREREVIMLQGRNGQDKKDAALRKLKKVTETEAGAARVFDKVATDQQVRNINRRMEQQHKITRPEPINPRTVYATEPWLEVDEVEYFINDDQALRDTTEPIKVAAYNDKQFILNGHHRLAAAKLLGVSPLPGEIHHIDDDDALYQEQFYSDLQKVLEFLLHSGSLKNDTQSVRAWLDGIVESRGTDWDDSEIDTTWNWYKEHKSEFSRNAFYSEDQPRDEHGRWSPGGGGGGGIGKVIGHVVTKPIEGVDTKTGEKHTLPSDKYNVVHVGQVRRSDGSLSDKIYVTDQENEPGVRQLVPESMVDRYVEGKTKEGRDIGGAQSATSVKPPINEADSPRYVREIEASKEYKAIQDNLKRHAADTKSGDYMQWSREKNTDEHGNYTPEREKLHEQIIKGGLNEKAVAGAGEKPKLTLVIGAPGSGKTSIGTKFATGEHTYINPDEIKEKLPGYKPGLAGIFHEESKDIADNKMLPRAIAARHNIMLDVTGANSSKTEKIANEAGAKGYDVHVIHVDVPSHQIAQRVWERAKLGEGRFVPLKYASDDVDHRPSTTYKNLKSNPYVKSGVSVDNSGGKGSPPRVLDRYER